MSNVSCTFICIKIVVKKKKKKKKKKYNRSYRETTTMLYFDRKSGEEFNWHRFISGISNTLRPSKNLITP